MCRGLNFYSYSYSYFSWPQVVKSWPTPTPTRTPSRTPTGPTGPTPTLAPAPTATYAGPTDLLSYSYLEQFSTFFFLFSASAVFNSSHAHANDPLLTYLIAA